MTHLFGNVFGRRLFSLVPPVVYIRTACARKRHQRSCRDIFSYLFLNGLFSTGPSQTHPPPNTLLTFALTLMIALILLLALTLIVTVICPLNFMLTPISPSTSELKGSLIPPIRAILYIKTTIVA